MTDRELLELAAKAADIAWNPDSGNMETGEIGATGIPMMERWNPLEDDGDALRLACDLGLRVYPIARTASGEACSCAASVTGERLSEVSDASIDIRAATRHAIVLAAAEVGRRMP